MGSVACDAIGFFSMLLTRLLWQCWFYFGLADVLAVHARSSICQRKCVFIPRRDCGLRPQLNELQWSKVWPASLRRFQPWVACDGSKRVNWMEVSWTEREDPWVVIWDSNSQRCHRSDTDIRDGSTTDSHRLIGCLWQLSCYLYIYINIYFAVAFNQSNLD